MAKTATKKTGDAKSKKGASPYNKFMATELARLKKADPKLAHKYAQSFGVPTRLCLGPHRSAPWRPRRAWHAVRGYVELRRSRCGARHAARGYVGLRRA